MALLEGWGAGICIMSFHMKRFVPKNDLETEPAGWKYNTRDVGVSCMLGQRTRYVF
jgi:hypothetical protein